MKKTLAFIVSSFTWSLGAVPTVELAQNLKFFDYMRNLRTKADEFLASLENGRKTKIIDYEMRDMHDHATQEREELQDLYEKVSDTIDKRFEAIDELIVIDGDRLDLKNATDEQKIALINKARGQAQATIEQFIKNYR